MMRQRQRDLTRSKLLGFIDERRDQIPGAISGESVLAEVSSGGLLTERDEGIYAFAHLTFQEYLAATHVRQHNLQDELLESADDLWWHEVILLYVAHADAEAVVRACLDRQTMGALAVAFEAADTLAVLAPDL